MKKDIKKTVINVFGITVIEENITYKEYVEEIMNAQKYGYIINYKDNSTTFITEYYKYEYDISQCEVLK